MTTAPSEHLIGIYREWLTAPSVLSSADLTRRRGGEQGARGGQNIVQQRLPSTKGLVFLTLEDETELINLIVRPKTYERYRETFRGSPLVMGEGALQREGLATSVQVYQAVPLFR